MATPDMEVIKEIPGYKVILKAVLKNQIQQLVETLAQHTDEESVILTASVSDGTLSHLGSDSGKFFLEDHEDVKSQFLGFCLKRHHRQKQAEKDQAAEAQRSQPPVIPTQMGLGPGYSPHAVPRGRGPRSNIARHSTPRHSMPSARHEPYPAARPQKQRNSIDNQSFEQGPGAMTLPTSTAGSSFVKQEPADGDSMPSSHGGGDSNQGPGDDSNLSSDANFPHTPSNNDNMESDLDPNVNVKVESRGESELEITGVEPSKMVEQVPENWAPDPKMLYDGTGATGNQGDMPGGSQDLYNWHVSVFGEELDMSTVKEDILASKLSKFYCEARQQGGPHSSNTVGDYYHTNTLKNIRAAVNRHVQDIGRNINIVKDKEFVASNKILTGLVKTLVASGVLKAQEKKDAISSEDLVKINKYLCSAQNDAYILRQCVYYQMAIHFCTSGLEFHYAKRNSVKFHVNDNGVEYVTLDLIIEAPRKLIQSSNFKPQLVSENHQNKRMYANGAPNCPVKMLRLMIDKTVPEAEALFNCVSHKADLGPTDYWYGNKALSKRTISKLVPDICKGSNCTGRYTAYSLKATAKSLKTNASSGV